MPFRYSPQLPSGMCAAAPHHPNPASPPIPPLPRLTAPSVLRHGLISILMSVSIGIAAIAHRHRRRRRRASPLSTDPLPCSHPALSVCGKHTTAAVSLPTCYLYLIHLYDHHHSSLYTTSMGSNKGCSEKARAFFPLSLPRRRPRIIAHPNPVHCRPGCPQPPPSRNHHCL